MVIWKKVDGIIMLLLHWEKKNILTSTADLRASGRMKIKVGWGYAQLSWEHCLRTSLKRNIIIHFKTVARWKINKI